jgi:hypothetical protein
LNWSQLLPAHAEAGKRRIVILGDLMLDEQIHGSVHRISPEAPVPVVRVTSRTHHPGGAANVARNVSALGGQAELAGIAGDDEAGRILHELLSAAGIGTAAVVPSWPTDIITSSGSMKRLPTLCSFRRKKRCGRRSNRVWTFARRWCFPIMQRA